MIQAWNEMIEIELPFPLKLKLLHWTGSTVRYARYTDVIMLKSYRI